MWALALRALGPMVSRGAASAATRAGAGAMESKVAGQASSRLLSGAQKMASGSSGNQRSPQPTYTTNSTGPTAPQITARMMGRGER